MSHYTVLVTGENVEEDLAPYDENIVLEPYIKYTRAEAIAKERNLVEEFLTEYNADPAAFERRYMPFWVKKVLSEFPHRRAQWTDEDYYKEAVRQWEPDMIDAEGNLLSTYNPKSRWDWWVVGGRWAGELVLKSGTKVDVAQVKDIDVSASLLPTFAVLHDGKWYERGQMGWWGQVSNEKSQDSWFDQFSRIWESLPGDMLVTMVDAHI